MVTESNKEQANVWLSKTPTDRQLPYEHSGGTREIQASAAL